MQTSTQNPLLQNGERFITINGIAHWCKIAGAEHHTTPLVIVHGGPGGNLYAFERVIGPLLEQFATVIYYEQRGSGRSEKPQHANDYSIALLVEDMDKLRQELGLEKIIPLGSSFGGWLALEYALAYPEPVEKIVLAGPWDGNDARSTNTQIAAFQFVSEGAIKEQIHAILTTPNTAAQHIDQIRSVADSATFDRLLFHQPEAAKHNRALWNESGLLNNGDMDNALRSAPAPRLLDRLPGMTCPTLCIVGLHDRNTGVEMARDICTALPNAQMIIFENSAHFPDSEEPERFATLVREFIASQRG